MAHKDELLEDIKDKEYRDAFVSSHADACVAFQVRALRKQRKYTQKKLAEMAYIKQRRISTSENPNNTPNISTLKKIANAFDVGLVVRFVPISDLVEWDINLSCDSLDVLSFDEEIF